MPDAEKKIPKIRRLGVPIKANVYIEFVFAAIILFAIYKFIVFFHYEGYLPVPFFDNAGDTFMDWYNTVYWGYRGGTYDEWFAIYPPFAFLFMMSFSLPSCYSASALIGRECDPLGAWVVTAFGILNAVLVYLEYRKADSRTALPRAVAVGLGTSALFGWERGNVIVCCFTFYILAHGTMVRSVWLRWLFFGMTVNLKPYLILMVLGRLLRRKWRWAEGCGVSCVLIYVVSYMIFGKGNPFELISNMFMFSGTPENVTIYFLDYATTYNAMLEILKTQLPLMFYLGSKPMEMVEHIAPLVIKLADLGVLICCAGALLRPTKLSSFRISAMAMVLLLTTTKTVGGYAEVFLFFFVFFEKWDRVGQVVALVAAYALCVPWDMILVNIIHVDSDAWLSGRSVNFNFGLTLGGLVRPGLLLAIQYGLVVASLMDLTDFRWPKRESPTSSAPAGLQSGVGIAVS
jgi:predicted outer membrane lipoprotein